MCGGTGRGIELRTASRGLSPRVRGNLRVVLTHPPQIGSIPACAGEPALGTAFNGVAGVYPRVCGGTVAGRGLRAPGWGLSPRVRGNPGVADGHQVVKRSIPACAGEPGGLVSAFGAPRVYPRVCGGTQEDFLHRWQRRGLSPRVRWNLSYCISGNRGRGSIPACAGEPDRLDRSRICRAVYPRVCGGTLQPVGQAAFDEGLSPRVRGNLVPVLAP